MFPVGPSPSHEPCPLAASPEGRGGCVVTSLSALARRGQPALSGNFPGAGRQGRVGCQVSSDQDGHTPAGSARCPGAVEPEHIGQAPEKTQPEVGMTRAPQRVAEQVGLGGMARDPGMQGSPPLFPAPGHILPSSGHHAGLCPRSLPSSPLLPSPLPACWVTENMSPQDPCELPAHSSPSGGAAGVLRAPAHPGLLLLAPFSGWHPCP